MNQTGGENGGRETAGACMTFSSKGLRLEVPKIERSLESVAFPTRYPRCKSKVQLAETMNALHECSAGPHQRLAVYLTDSQLVLCQRPPVEQSSDGSFTFSVVVHENPPHMTLVVSVQLWKPSAEPVPRITGQWAVDGKLGHRFPLAILSLACLFGAQMKRYIALYLHSFTLHTDAKFCLSRWLTPKRKKTECTGIWQEGLIISPFLTWSITVSYSCNILYNGVQVACYWHEGFSGETWMIKWMLHLAEPAIR